MTIVPDGAESEYEQTNREQFNFYSWSDLQSLAKAEWQIDKIFPVASFVVVYGGSGEGKSFLALDLALSVANGQPWLGRPVRQGPVVYVAAEGGRGIRNRVAAWMHHNSVSNIPNSSFLLEAVQPTQREEMERLVTKMRELDIQPTLIVIDTLARCFGGNENSSEDVGAFVRGLTWLQQETEATVMVLHHTGKYSDKERGSSALRAAVDVMVKVSMNDDGVITVTNDKMKEDEEFASIRLELKQVTVPDSAGSSCVLVKGDKTLSQSPERLPSHLRRALVTLTKYGEGCVTRRELIDGSGIPERTLDGHLKELEQLKYVERPKRGLYRVTPEGLAACQSTHGSAATATNLQLLQGGKSPTGSAASATTTE